MMKRLIGYAGAVVTGGILAIGTAAMASAAPDVDGETYGDAAVIIQASGGSPKVATRVGTGRQDAECIVTHATEASFVRPGGRHFAVDTDNVLVSLNCAD